MNSENILCAHADHKTEHYFYQRQQSRSLQDMEWEDRLNPQEPWLSVIANGIGLAVFFAAVLAYMCVGR